MVKVGPPQRQVLVESVAESIKMQDGSMVDVAKTPNAPPAVHRRGAKKVWIGRGEAHTYRVTIALPPMLL
jgi:hypothetical protein